MNKCYNMKAKAILILLTCAAANIATAQVQPPIWGRCERYIYSQWYDECAWYQEDPGVLLNNARYYNIDGFRLEPGKLLAVRSEVDGCTVVGGVAVMISLDRSEYSCNSTGKIAEEVALFLPDPSGGLGDSLAAARWDTAHPIVMMLPHDRQRELAGDTTSYMRVLVYEAMFDHPVTLQSSYIVAGTFNSNELARDGWPILYKNQPTEYATIRNTFGNPCDNCMDEDTLFFFTQDSTGWRRSTNPRQGYCGPFLLIPVDCQLTTLAADTLMGSVTGGGTYHSSVPVTVSATPARFCRFDHWSDGSTDNPRVMHLCGDSTVTAFFRHDSSNYVRVLPNNPDWGATTGTGIYPYGASVTIEATPAAGYLFTEWADGSTDNPRTVLPVSDTVFTALFDPPEVGINTVGDSFSVTPNPTDGTVTVTAATSGYTLRLFDSAGRLTLQRQATATTTTIDLSGLPSGAYTIALTDDSQTLTKAIIKL